MNCTLNTHVSEGGKIPAFAMLWGDSSHISQHVEGIHEMTNSRVCNKHCDWRKPTQYGFCDQSKRFLHPNNSITVHAGGFPQNDKAVSHVFK